MSCEKGTPPRREGLSEAAVSGGGRTKPADEREHIAPLKSGISDERIGRAPIGRGRPILTVGHTHLRIPDDVAVMGYDDREIAQHLHPPLTTVLLPHFEMGSIAAEMLLDAASGSTSRPRQIKVECPIVKRGSV